MRRGEPNIRRRTAFCALALAFATIVAPLSDWSTVSAAGPTPQTITFLPLANRTLDQPALVVNASATSGLPVTFTSTTPSVCSATGTNGTVISPSISGVCTVQADQAGNLTFAAAPAVTQSFTVSKGQQTITFSPISDRLLNQGAFVVTATASTGFAVTFTTTTPAVCTSSGTHGATITPVTPGQCTVDADQPGNNIFDPAPTVTQSFNVGKSSQAITFAPLVTKTTLQSPVTVSATSTSLLTVTFSTTTPTVCTASGVSGATITLVTSGSCTVQADQPGNAQFSAAPSVQRSFVVTRTAQTIAFPSPGNHTANESPISVGATASSGLTVTFSATTPSVCSAAGTSITLLAAGTCTVQADQAGNATWAPASPVAQSFTVTKSDQTISFGALADQGVFAPPVTVGATASSGLVVTFSTTTPAVCTAGGTSGATISLVTPGTCTVKADQPGNALYNAAPSVPASFTVTKAGQTITFAALADLPIGPPITVTATASSELTVAFSTTTPTVCTSGGVNGATITMIAIGTCTVEADQPGDTNYNPAPPVTQSFGVGKTDQTITFGSLPSVAVDQAPITVAATATSGLTVAFSTTTPSVCTASGVNGTTITLLAAGTCSVEADQPGDVAFNAAPAVTRSFAVSKLTQSITFGALGAVTLPHPPVTLAATASSLLAVTFSSATPGSCTTGGTNGAQLTFVKAGTCTVLADQSGDATFQSAVTVTRQFAVKGPVTVNQKSGYWMLGADGHVYAFGDATGFGSTGAPAVAFAARRDGRGYWIVDAGGDVRAFGNATFHGGRPALSVGEGVSTISATPSGKGYWLFTSTGRVFAYGDARFFGDMSAVTLNGPIVASTATPTGLGYYMVASDGGVFSFGDAHFHGSMGAAHLNQPIVGLSPTPDNHSYWLVASDGGVFAFGAPFRGSLGALSLNKPVNGLVAYGNGYLMVASDGGVFDFSDQAFVGSLGDKPPAAPIVGIAALVAG